jgi:hypothetical protein
MGRKTLPASGMEWKAMGSTTHRATHTADRVIRLMEFITFILNASFVLSVCIISILLYRLKPPGGI